MVPFPVTLSNSWPRFQGVGSKITTRMNFLTPICLIHCDTFIRLRWRLNCVLKRFLGKNFGVAHALYHVTLTRRVQNNHSYAFFEPYLPIHYATVMRLRWWRCSKGSTPIVKRVLGKNFLSPVKNGPQNGANSGKWSRYEILCSLPWKGTSLRGPACFGVFCVKILQGPLAVESCKNCQKTNMFLCAKSRMRGNETFGHFVTNFFTGVDHLCWFVWLSLTGFGHGSGGGGWQILGFSIDLRRRPYITLVPCECMCDRPY